MKATTNKNVFSLFKIVQRDDKYPQSARGARHLWRKRALGDWMVYIVIVD